MNNILKYPGLTPQQIEESRKKHGTNKLTPPPRDPWWLLLLSKFDDPLIRILIVAATISLAIGVINKEYIEPIGIILAILLATTLAFINEFKAAKEFDVLNQVSDEMQVKVIRNALFCTVAIKDLVVGDIVVLEPGDEIPADGTLLEGISLQVDQSKLTGESVPANKFVIESNSPQKQDEEDTYPCNFLLRSTMIVDGSGLMEISSVGDSTEIGKASRLASEETDTVTPLNLQLAKLSKLIEIIGFSIAFLVFIVLVIKSCRLGDIQLSTEQWRFVSILFFTLFFALTKLWLPIIAEIFNLFGKKLRLPGLIKSSKISSWIKVFFLSILFFFIAVTIGTKTGFLPPNPHQCLTLHNITDFLTFFMIAVAIIVVAVPEGLPMSVTLSLAYSMRRMTASNNLVRHMHACETIGAASVICSDKTGTLTQNRMLINQVFFPSLATGTISDDLTSNAEKIVVEALSVNSSANLNQKCDSENVRVIGNPTEGATLIWLSDMQIDYLQFRLNFKIEKRWAFSTETKMMGTYGLSGLDNKKVLYVKGAPEFLLKRSKQILFQDSLQDIEKKKEEIEQQLRDCQAKGMRTLAIAFKTDPKVSQNDSIKDVVHDMIWLGFISIADPLREDVKPSIELCQKAGVKIKIVTGDTPLTTREIARQLDILPDNPPQHAEMTGDEFQKLTDEEALERVEDIVILSRARPADKLRMVKLLQKKNHVVAVTGDGTNDAPALNHANVGLAMGLSGTSVAREASDIILLDDSFNTLVNGIMWGRSLYKNIQRFIMFQLTINFVALGIAFTGPFIGIQIPLTVTQMLWVNLIMDTLAALSLASEPPHAEVMDSPPRKHNDFIISPVMKKHIFGVGICFYLIFVGMLKYMLKNDSIVDSYELTIFFTTFVMINLWNMFNARVLDLSQSALKHLTNNKGFLFIVPAILLIQILIVQYGGSMFRTVPLAPPVWFTIVAATSTVLWFGELLRFFSRKRAEE